MSSRFASRDAALKIWTCFCCALACGSSKSGVPSPHQRDETKMTMWFSSRGTSQPFSSASARQTLMLRQRRFCFLKAMSGMTIIGDFSSRSSGNRSVIHEVGETLTGGFGFMSWMMWCMREPARASVSENQLIAAKPAM